MADFMLRIWHEQVLFDCYDYIVEAETLEKAVELLQEYQEKADDQCGLNMAPVTHESIIRIDFFRGKETILDDGIRPLDPEEIVAGDSGVALLDAHGCRIRDLDSVPTGCTQLGVPLGCQEPTPDPNIRVQAALKALAQWGLDHTSPRDENSPHDLLIEAVGALKAAGVEV